MNIYKSLEAEHSKGMTQRLVEYIGSDKKRIKELVTIFLSDDAQLSQRAAWVLGDIGTREPSLISGYLSKLIVKLKEPGIHPAIPRNILRWFQAADLPEKYQAEVFDLCFSFIVSESQPIAIRAFSITVATRIASNYPELQTELAMVLKDLSLLPQTPAIKVRLKYALKELSAAVSRF